MKFQRMLHNLASSQRYRVVIVGITAIVTSLLYLLISSNLTGIGYPLDDAWIHQTYARNLVVYGEWSFVPGQVSGGSTSPLWTVILSLGQVLGIPVIWTFAAGTILFAASAITGVEILRNAGNNPVSCLLFGLILATEWHLIWASVSGMETILLIFIILLFFYFLYDNKRFWISGLLVGIAIWIRPDSIMLVGPWLWVILFLHQKEKKVWNSLVKGGFFLLIFVGLYLGFNYSLTGNVWPNTFYAKQAEYISMLDTPFLMRFIQLFSLPWNGASVLLLPGLVITIIAIIKSKNISYFAPILWAFGYILIFAVRLPVTYQHGRYIMPVMPILFLVGFWGIQKVFQSVRVTSARRRILSAGWVGSITVAQIGFIFLGARSFANDVAFINTEMIATAQWIQENTEKDALIAAHDIGALGYYSNREIIDLAGLITPEVIPFIRDENRLGEYITAEKADYLMIFPSWYPALAERATPVYHSNAWYSPELGGESMYIYRWAP